MRQGNMQTMQEPACARASGMHIPERRALELNFFPNDLIESMFSSLSVLVAESVFCSRGF